LNRALQKGLLRQYRWHEYNDSNVKGQIDVARHLKLNIPFVGKIAYRTREYDANNAITELVRHTIEYINSSSELYRSILSGSETRRSVRKIKEVTPSYKPSARKRIITQNQRPLKHAYYHEYRDLQRLCLAILRHDNISFGESKNEVYGVLFDGAWLWEEYINVIFRENPLISNSLLHPRNKAKDGKGFPQELFYDKEDSKETGLIYPDFLIGELARKKDKVEKCAVVADAKYKPINNIRSADYLQLVAYLCRFQAHQGFYIYPEKDSSKTSKPLILLPANRSPNISIQKLGFSIPDSSKHHTFGEFKDSMEEQEKRLVCGLRM
jgi:5-methylcytosine-specific restriction endonuclease McrBC regulatory subunit McrC